MEMEPGCPQGALQKLCDRLFTETEPRKLYKVLKKLASWPTLSESLAEIGFRQTIKVLKKQQLLVPFAKDLAARWSERSLLGPRSEANRDSRDSASGMSMEAEQGRPSPGEEPQAPASGKEQDKRDERDERAEVFQVSSGTPGPSRRRSPGPRPEARDPGSGRLEPAAKRMRRCSQSALRWSQEEGRPGSLGACLHCEQACCCVGGPEPCGDPSERGAQLGPRRVNSKTPVYSGPRPEGVPQEPPAGHLLAEDATGTWGAPCQAKEADAADAADVSHAANPAQGAERGHAGHHGQPGETQTHSHTETKTQRQAEEADQELRLQALTARIRSRQAKRQQGRRQTQMVAFLTQARSPGQQEENGPPPRGPSSEKHLHPEASGHDPTQRALCNKAPAKKRPAPLMAKAVRDYGNRFSRR